MFLKKSNFEILSQKKTCLLIFLFLGCCKNFYPNETKHSMVTNIEPWIEINKKGKKAVNLVKLYTNKNGKYDLTDQFRKYYPAKKLFLQPDKCTDILYGGSIKTDYYATRHAETLSKANIDDAFDQFRQRSEFSLKINKKMDQYRQKPVAEGQITLGNVMFWRTNYKPTNLSLAGAERTGPYDPIFLPVKINLQEAWFKINFDQIVSNNEPYELYLKAGFFPFFLGRGISLGDWVNGGPAVFGFSNSGVQIAAPKFAPGILLSGTVYENMLEYQLYYSPAVTEDVVPSSEADKYTVVSTEKDILSDRHIIAGRLLFTADFYDQSKTLAEPYFVYYNSPRHCANTNFDSTMRFLSFGFMLDHKAGGFEFNFEVARQFGRHKIKEFVNKSRPSHEKFMDSDAILSFPPNKPNLLDPYPGKIVQSNGYVFSNGNPATIGTITANNPAYSPLPANNDGDTTNVSGLSNWNSLDKTKNFFERHPSYELDLAGRMAVFDMRYTFDNYPLQIAGAVGYFSGDQYPYNDDVDRQFAGEIKSTSSTQPVRKSKIFIPLRDYHYTGLWALPMIMSNAGIVPRSYNASLMDGYAYNEQTAMTNLVYVVGGFTISPINNLQKFKIQPNVAIYWTDGPTYVYDSKKQKPTNIQTEDQVLQNLSGTRAKEFNTLKPEDYSYSARPGYETNIKASNSLGWEINCLANYYITDSLDLMFKVGFFFPGKFYEQKIGQPDVITARTTTSIQPDGNLFIKYENKGLGMDTAYGFNIRIGYTF